jgi:hypothetical protein
LALSGLPLSSDVPAALTRRPGLSP